MHEASTWITPLALLPGVGLLVMSTGLRFGQLHEEIHRRERDVDDMRGHLHGIDHLIRRALLFRNALIALYTSAVLLAVSGLIGGVASLSMTSAASVVIGMSAVAVACLAYAAVTLIRESLLLTQVIEEHRTHDARHADDERAPPPG